MIRVAGRFAALVTLWLAVACTPVTVPPSDDRTDPVLGDSHFISFDGARLPLRSWLPDGDPVAIILALHGFNDYSNAFNGFGGWAASRGVAVHAYDQRGFGDAPGRGYWHEDAALTGDAEAALRLLKTRYPGKPLYLLGMSMGGAIAMLALDTTEAAEIADGAILVAPAVWGTSTQSWWQRTGLWLFAHTVPYLTPTGRGLGIHASDNIEMLRALGRDEKVIKRTRIDAVYGVVQMMDRALAASPRLREPALVLYGARDEVIPAGPTKRMLDALPRRDGGSQRVAIYPKGCHMLLRDLQAEVVWRDIVAWTRDRAAALPSGAETQVTEIETEPCPWNLD